MVLAAGAGRRLRPYTDTLPKTLVPIADGATVLDGTLRNFAEVGLTDAVLVVGYAADALRERRTALERAHGVRLHLVDNDKAEVWNNAYSLWCARDSFAEGVLLANGDTVHPVSVEETLLAARGPALLLAVDTEKQLAEEEMKVALVGRDGPAAHHQAHGAGDGVRRVHRRHPHRARGRGAPGRRARDDLAARPRPVLRGRLPGAGRPAGSASTCAPIGSVDWVEIDDLRDLERARELACRS